MSRRYPNPAVIEMAEPNVETSPDVENVARRSNIESSVIFILPARAEHHWMRAEQVRLAMDQGKPEGELGGVFSDTGYILPGEIIERQIWEELGLAVRNLINYGKLGLSSIYREQMEARPDGGLFSGAMLYDIDMTHHEPSFDIYGGGGLISTTVDLARFFRALIIGDSFEEKRTLSVLLTVPSTWRGAETPLVSNGVIPYRLGRFDCIGHTGFWGRFAVYCPENDVAIAWSTNNGSPAKAGRM